MMIIIEQVIQDNKHNDDNYQISNLKQKMNIVGMNTAGILLMVLLSSVSGNNVSCYGTPFLLLSKCNITCDKCGETRKVCLQCQSELVLTNLTCIIEITNTATLISELSTADFSGSNLQLFEVDSAPFNSTMHTSILCGPFNYKFMIMGFYNQQQVVSYSRQMDYQISYIQIKMRFIILFENTLIQISLNNGIIHEQLIKSANLTINDTYSSTQNPISYYQIPSLNNATVQSLLIPIQTQRKSLNQRDIQFSIQGIFQSNRTMNEQLWGFQQCVIYVKYCQNCISLQLIGLSIRLGTAFGIISLILTVLIIILCINVHWIDKAYCQRIEKDQKDYIVKNKFVNRISLKKT